MSSGKAGLITGAPVARSAAEREFLFRCQQGIVEARDKSTKTNYLPAFQIGKSVRKERLTIAVNLTDVADERREIICVRGRRLAERRHAHRSCEDLQAAEHVVRKADGEDFRVDKQQRLGACKILADAVGEIVGREIACT